MPVAFKNEGEEFLRVSSLVSLRMTIRNDRSATMIIKREQAMLTLLRLFCLNRLYIELVATNGWT